MAYIVKCPICGKIKKVDSRVKYYFKCDWCHIAVELKSNIIAKSFVLPRKEKETKEDDMIEIELVE